MSIADKFHDYIPGWAYTVIGGFGAMGLEYLTHDPRQIKHAAADASAGVGFMCGISDNPGWGILGYGIANLGTIGEIIKDFSTYGLDVSYSDSVERLATRGALWGAGYILGRLIGGKR